jgi:hypothetical protein
MFYLITTSSLLRLSHASSLALMLPNLARKNLAYT